MWINTGDYFAGDEAHPATINFERMKRRKDACTDARMPKQGSASVEAHPARNMP